MRLKIPEFCLVVLVGPSGAGKSSFARKHFLPTEVISSDQCRAMVADDENAMDATGDAFELLHYIAGKRLAARRLTVIDATSVKPEDRKPLVRLAREYHALTVAIVLQMPERLCHARNQSRPDRDFGPHVVRNHVRQLRRSLRGMKREGIRYIHVFKNPEELEPVEIERVRLWTDRRDEQGPFDLIGDVHGCYDELRGLMDTLGYVVREEGGGADARFHVSHPEGRRIVFLGDLVDRGPKIAEALHLAMDMVEEGSAFCVPGNHEVKLLRKLRGKNVTLTHGLAETVEQLDARPDAFRTRVADFIDGLVSHFVLDGGRLVAAHAGMTEDMQGRASGAVRSFALYGETTGETDEYGLPVRYNWAADYRGKAMVVYGHTPVPEVEWINRTVCLDTGCVFGGKLSALRYPEREIVQTPALATYYESVKPLVPVDPGPGAARGEGVLDLDDVWGKRVVATRLRRNVTIGEAQSAAALEVMGRFAADPRWLIYLPPTMSPSETSAEPGLLEHPAEAFDHYTRAGVETVVCEEKHMGSRAVVIACRDADAAHARFRVGDGAAGIVYTRTGRPFFNDPALEAEFLGRFRAALDAAGFWARFETDWACLDCELMPWSAKARALLLTQYAPLAAAARMSLRAAVVALDAATSRGLETGKLLERYQARERMTAAYADAYAHYCWPVSSVDDLRIAPFHLLATEGKTWVDRRHDWHMGALGDLAGAGDGLVQATGWKTVTLADKASRADAIDWWGELTGRGGEGMVVKPLDFVVMGRRGLAQPALKCRGKEYLRIIYGPEYDTPGNLERLRKRGLGRKRSLALREFALGVEGLERFVAREPLHRVHECAFGVLALESEPVDPRL